MRFMTITLLSSIILMGAALPQAKAQSVSLTLAPHGSQSFENSFGFSVDAICSVHSNDSSQKTIKLHLVENTGVINGKHLNKGQSTSITMKDQKSLSVHAEPGSKVDIQNLSNQTIEATCSV